MSRRRIKTRYPHLIYQLLSNCFNVTKQAVITEGWYLDKNRIVLLLVSTIHLQFE